MDEVLLNAIRVIEGIQPNQNNFSFNYLFSSENISGFTRKISFKNKNILTVCSSGDQAFNMILNGCGNIDLFDINIFSKYYFHLKLAVIKSLSYEEFFDFFLPKNRFDDDNVFSFETYLDVRNNINDDSIRDFWDYLFCHYPGKIIYNSKLFTNLDYSRKTYKECNDYLKNEINYNRLKEQLLGRDFNFYNIDIFREYIPSNTKYDFVYLSNILGCLRIRNKLEYIKKVKEIVLKIKSNLLPAGMIAVSYIYLYYDDYVLNNNADIFKSYSIRQRYFEEFELLTFSGIFLPKSRNLKNNDALILYKNN